jgi:DNA (cytosine-5)-methyltransferase 1
MTYGFPCQDISIAGRQQGLSKGSGTRSSLLWEAMRIAKYKKPKYLIAENVKHLVGRKFKSDFEKWIKELDQLGYNTYYTILNAKNHGIPQNRERVFVVSIRKDIDGGTFNFPEPINLNKSLWDFLETDINEEYYVNEHFLNQIRNTKFRKDRYIESTRKVVNKEYNENLIMDYRYDEGLRIRKNNLCPTLTTRGKSSISGVALIYRPDDRLRFITPLECWRLMGFTDEDYNAALSTGVTTTQLYKQAGNSIVVLVLEAIFKNLFKNKIN